MNPVSFWDTQALVETPEIRGRCDAEYLETRLKEKHPNAELHVVSVTVNETGSYQNPLASAFLEMFASGFKMDGLPAYVEVQLEHKLPGDHTAQITIWSPLAWNDRFLGTGGGAASTGGVASMNRADDTSRGMTVPNAVYNGFTAATTDSGNVSFMHDWALDSATNTLDWERIENWRARGTHWMTVLAKDVAEILHQRPIQFSYFHGASGGGRQAMVEAQEYPADYDGIWASSPAINWTKALLAGIWPIAVMNSHGQILSPVKLEAFRLAVHESVSGSVAYFRLRERVKFDPKVIVGKETEDGPITEQDAVIMSEIWDGPRRPDGERMWYSFRPGGLFWNAQGAPVTSFYYQAGSSKPLVFPFYAKWVVQDAARDFLDITKKEFYAVFEKSITLFSKSAGDSIELNQFEQKGGKLIIDHGTDDPLIPVEGTIDYYDRLCEALGGTDRVKNFCLFYLNPGDGHAGCNWHGLGLTESTGMRTLINWVEQEKTPQKLHGIQIDPATGEQVYEGELEPI